jgi:DNA-binding GntR family transcriptional regulator
MVRIWYPKTYYIPETKDLTIEEHRAIADAIADHDAARAAEVMRKHLIQAGGRLRRILSSA